MTTAWRASGSATSRPTATPKSFRRRRCTISACAFLPTATTCTSCVVKLEVRSLKYLHRAPVLGGTPQKLVTDIDTNITFSPDGRRFAFVLDNNPAPGKYRLIIRSLSGGDETTLASGSLDTVWWIRPGPRTAKLSSAS